MRGLGGLSASLVDVLDSGIFVLFLLDLVATQAYTKSKAKKVCVGAYAPTHTFFATSLNAG
jgi:hypothetical protein